VNLYHSANGEYLVQTSPRSYVALDRYDVKLHAMRNGIPQETEKNLSPIDSMFYRAHTHGHVYYAGPLAGHRVGLLTRPSGEKLLVTSECNFFSFFEVPGGGGCRQQTISFIEKFLTELFVDGHEYVISWLSCAVKSLLRCDFSPGQMLALAGPPGCGKSFFHYLVTQTLGGRMAKPYPFLTGKTAFNGDLARAEHLIIEDEVASSDIRARRTFGSGLKQFTVGEEMHIHDKGKIAFTAPTYKRMTLSVNDEAENLMILPPFDASIMDKVMLLRCKDAKTVLHDSREQNKAEVAKEMPAFRRFLLKYRVPKRIACPRFGVVSFHNPDLLDMVSDTQPEHRLRQVIDEVFTETWKGTATELEMRLRASAFAPVAHTLFYYPTSCGVYLSRLANKSPDRFSAVKVRGRTVWTIRTCGGV
jgi:hypothetical protein